MWLVQSLVGLKDAKMVVKMVEMKGYQMVVKKEPWSADVKDDLRVASLDEMRVASMVLSTVVSKVEL